MTSFRIERLPFTSSAVGDLRRLGDKFTNWPAVYTLGDSRKVYVGESLNVAARLGQHLASKERAALSTARVVIDPSFNKSVCLDLESTLIRLLAGDGHYEVINRNDGISNSDYYDRARYRTVFREIFEQLRSEGVFTRSIEEIENSDLFKLSPFKALSPEQSAVVEDILEGLFGDIAADVPSRIAIQGVGATGPRVEWDAYDVLAPDGTRIEVKTSAYLQVWSQRRASQIRFSGPTSRTWNPRTGYSDLATFNADIYVFAVQTSTSHEDYNVLSVGQWEFYVATRAALESTGFRSLNLAAVTRTAIGPLAWTDLADVIRDARDS